MIEERYLFRGKLINNGKWIKGSLQIYPDGSMSIKEINVPWPNGLFGSVDPVTVGQCTGMKDKNGKLIWEGDIIQFCDRLEWYKCTFGFDAGDFVKYPYYREVIELPKSYKRLLDDEIQEYWEVVGNIYDNCDLLEEGVD